MKPEKALAIALDAAASDVHKAAKKHKVHRATVDRARAQVEATPELREIAKLKKKEMAERLHDKRVEVIELMLDGLKVRLPTMEDRDFVGAYKIVTDNHEVALRVIADADGPRSADREPSQPDQPPAREGPGGSEGTVIKSEPSPDGSWITVSSH